MHPNRYNRGMGNKMPMRARASCWFAAAIYLFGSLIPVALALPTDAAPGWRWLWAMPPFIAMSIYCFWRGWREGR
jgi:hypothetical protein